MKPLFLRAGETGGGSSGSPRCARLASLLDVPLAQAAQNVVPVAVTAGDKIEGLRQWRLGKMFIGGSGGRLFA